MISPYANNGLWLQYGDYDDDDDDDDDIQNVLAYTVTTLTMRNYLQKSNYTVYTPPKPGHFYIYDNLDNTVDRWE